MIRHAKIYKGVTMHARDSQGNKKEEKVKIKGNEHIVGLISHQFTFFMRGMLGTPKVAANSCQVPSVNAF